MGKGRLAYVCETRWEGPRRRTGDTGPVLVAGGRGRRGAASTWIRAGADPAGALGKLTDSCRALHHRGAGRGSEGRAQNRLCVPPEHRSGTVSREHHGHHRKADQGAAGEGREGDGGIRRATRAEPCSFQSSDERG